MTNYPKYRPHIIKCIAVIYLYASKALRPLYLIGLCVVFALIAGAIDHLTGRNTAIIIQFLPPFNPWLWFLSVCSILVWVIALFWVASEIKALFIIQLILAIIIAIAFFATLGIA